MFKIVNKILNGTTMYRLVLYVLCGLVIIAFIQSVLGLLPFDPWALLYSTAILIIVSWITNKLFVRIFKTEANVESVFITALILALLISPPQSYEYLTLLSFLIWAGIWSMAAKFVLAINKKHIFNPAAFAIALTAIVLGQSATWWVGTMYMLPFVIVGGLLIVKKIRRFDLVISFTVTALIMILVTTNSQGGFSGMIPVLRKVFVDSPIVFFALIMLTEPLTTPPRRARRIIYGVFTGLLFAPGMHIGSIYSTPELALLGGNVLSFLLGPMRKYTLTLKESSTIAKDTREFVFVPDHSIRFKPGQYLEWTLGQKHPDARGNRRFFTLASSPTEKDVRLGVKFYDHGSSYKASLAEMMIGQKILAHGVAGDFTLPSDASRKLVFIAGGIGITPFRSMVKYLIDTGEKRDITLIYSNNTAADIAYAEIWQMASKNLGIRIVHTLTDMNMIPSDWTGQTGFVSAQMIIREVPDYLSRLFYISGPHAMVDACKKVLTSIGVRRRDIRTDYFPGYA